MACTDQENAREHPHTPKPKRLKVNGVSPSQHTPRWQSNVTPAPQSGDSGRRASGIPLSELNWLATQEKSICVPSKDDYGSTTVKPATTEPAQSDEEEGVDGPAEQIGSEDEPIDSAQHALERRDAQKESEIIEQKRLADADRVSEEKRKQSEQERQAEITRLVREQQKRIEQEREAEEQLLNEQKATEAAAAAKAKEEQLLNEQKAIEAAAAAKAKEERIAKEAKDMAEQKRSKEERRSEKAKKVHVQKEQEEAIKYQEHDKEEKKRVAAETKKKQFQTEKEKMQKEDSVLGQHAIEEVKEARNVARSTKKKGKASLQSQVEKTRNAKEAEDRAQVASEPRSRKSSTPLVTPDNMGRGGRKRSSTPMIPSTTLAEQASTDKVKMTKTPGTPSRGTGLETQVPLPPSALRQRPTAVRRSVSFTNPPESSTVILPPGMGLQDLDRMRARRLREREDEDEEDDDDSVIFMEGKTQVPTAKSSRNNKFPCKRKVQTTLKVKRDVKLKGKVIDPPVAPGSTFQKSIEIESESDKSESSFYSDPEADPRQQNRAKAGPSTNKPSRSGSAKAGRTKSASVPPSITTKAQAVKPDPPMDQISDHDSIQSFRSESVEELSSQSVTRLPARDASQTAVSRSLSVSENGSMSSSPTKTRHAITKAAIPRVSSASSIEPYSSGGNTVKPASAFQPSVGEQASTQASQATSSQLSNGNTDSQAAHHPKSLDRELEESLQRAISRASTQPTSSQMMPLSSPPKPKAKVTQSKTLPAPNITTSITKSNSSSQSRSLKQRHPFLSDFKKNPPAWSFRDGKAASMPNHMKSKPNSRQSSNPMDGTKSLFVSQGSSQSQIIDLGNDDTSEEDSNSSSSDNNNYNRSKNQAQSHSTGQERRPGSAGAGAGKDAARGSTPAGRSSHGGALNRMWPWGGSSQNK